MRNILDCSPSPLLTIISPHTSSFEPRSFASPCPRHAPPSNIGLTSYGATDNDKLCQLNWHLLSVINFVVGAIVPRFHSIGFSTRLPAALRRHSLHSRTAGKVLELPAKTQP